MTVVKCDKHPADYCVIFDGAEVISAFYFVVGCLRLTRVVRFFGGSDGIFFEFLCF